MTRQRIIQAFIAFVSFFLASTPLVAATKGGINVGPYYRNISRAATSVGPNGWVYVLGCPGNLEQIAVEYNKSSNVNLMIRAFHRGSEFSNPENARKLAADWVKALSAIDTPNVIYFMPANEINNPVEGYAGPSGQFNGQAFDGLLIFLQDLQTQLAPLRDKKRVVLLSPSIDPFFLSDHADIQRPFIRRIPWGGFDGTAISLYGQYNGTTLDSTAPLVKQGNYRALEEFGVIFKDDVYVVETGVIKTTDGRVLYLENSSQIVDYLSKPIFDDEKIKSAIIFSYNPDPGGSTSPWIFSDTNVVNTLKNLGGGFSTTTVQVPASGSFEGLTGCVSTRESETEIVRAKHFNRLYNLDLPTAVRIFVATGLTGGDNISIGTFKPDDNYKLADKSLSANTYNQAIPALIPAKFKKVERDNPEYDLPPESGKINLKYNKNDIRSETQVNLCISDGVKQEQKQLLSGDNIINSQDLPNDRIQRDAAWILSAIASKEKIDTPDNSTKTEILETKQEFQCNNSDTGIENLPEYTDIPTGEIPFVTSTGNIITDVAIDITSSIIQGAIQTLSSAFSKDPKKTAEELGIPTTLVSTTNKTAVDDQNKKVLSFTQSKLPKIINQQIASQESDAEHKIKYQLENNEVEIGTVEVGGNQNVLSTKSQLCASLPKGSNKWRELNCAATASSVNPPNTSDWAVAGAQTPVIRENTPVDTIIREEAASVGIPACVLQGVGIIEGAYGWDPQNDPRILSCPVNVCSAAGPFQFTTGDNGRGDNCASCGLTYCPYTWDLYGQGKSPCEFRAAANAAARKLRDDGPLTTADPTTQFTQILKAGYHYYGSRLPVGRLKDSFGNSCSYGEYVFLQCNPSYKCGTQR